MQGMPMGLTNSGDREREERRLWGRRGFTLVEVMVAMILLFIGLLALMATTAGVIQGNDFSRQMTTALALAQEEMEILKGKSYPDGDLSAGDHSDARHPLNSIYTRTWTVTDDSPAADLKTIEVRVAWNRKGSAYDATLVTIIAR